MSIEVRVAALPESVSDATVLTWHKRPGDSITRDENLVDLETDKVVLEVPAPADGVLGELLHPQGDTVEVDDLLALIEPAGERPTPAPARPAPAEAGPEATRYESAPAEEPVLTPAVRRLVPGSCAQVGIPRASGRQLP